MTEESQRDFMREAKKPIEVNSSWGKLNFLLSGVSLTCLPFPFPLLLKTSFSYVDCITTENILHLMESELDSKTVLGSTHIY